MGMVTMAFNVVASASVITVGIGVYWDIDCIDSVSHVDWGSVKRGIGKNIIVFVRNEGNVDITLFLSTSNWNPPEAADYITLSWNYSGDSLEESEVVPVTLSLYVSASIEEIYAVAFDANMGAINGLTAEYSIPMAASISRTWTVDDDGHADFHTIQEAINAANEGDTVLVFSGTYYEHVVANKPLTLIGEEASTTIIDTEEQHVCLDITANYVNVTGFTMQNSGPYWGIYIFSNHTKISYNIITNNEYGVYPAGSNDTTIFGNNITNNRAGLYLVHSSYNKIYQNNFVNNTRHYGVTSSSNNLWDNGIVGNYWSNYEERYPDAKKSDDSVVWDTPYVITGSNQDNYPLTEPWSPPVMIKTLIRTVKFWSLNKGTENSLTSKLKGGLHHLETGDEDGAIHKLMIFINKVEAMKGKEVVIDKVDYLISEAQRIINLIEG